MRLQAEPVFKAPLLGAVILGYQGKGPHIQGPLVAPYIGPCVGGHFRGLFYTAHSIGIALFSFGKNTPFNSIGKVFIPPKIEAIVGACVGHTEAIYRGLSIEKMQALVNRVHKSTFTCAIV